MAVNGRARRRGRRRNGKAFGNPELADLSDDELLDLRFCDLDLKIEGTPLEDRIEQLYREMETRGFRFRPHFWLSNEWFTPDGIPGVAIPFYLADNRLRKLEDKMMFEVEGGTPEWCMRILRHETGHAIDNAYRLRRRSTYRKAFGNVSKSYPESYNPKPYSKSYVVNIDRWYAQSHPVEDFAETFAVWLKPRSRWRVEYEGWPALKKLEYVHKLMKEIKDQPARVRSRRHEEPLKSIKTTLREHYESKRDHYHLEDPHSYDHDLRHLFTDECDSSRRQPAAKFLRSIRPRLRRLVAEWTGHFQYTIDQVLREMIDRAEELELCRDRPAEEVERDVLVVLTMHTMNYIEDEAHKILL